ncbi:MAG: RDD family protein [Acidimicrobiia bacterium]|nr:RDD family protein [Acidimicrobiia bacterium]MCY4456826.1 RDD family protein [Acidimicrobiaceae bacterium]
MNSTQTDYPYMSGQNQGNTDPTAIMGRRIGAYVIDVGLATAVTLAVGFAALLVAFFQLATVEDVVDNATAIRICDEYNTFASTDICIPLGTEVLVLEQEQYGPLWSTTLIWTALSAVIFGLLNHVLLGWLAGGSLGKLMLGLRVVDNATFKKARFLKHLFRHVLWIVDNIPAIFPLVGLICGLTSKGHRRVGDMAAKTLVVRKEHLGKPVLVTGVNDAAMISVMQIPQAWGPPRQQPPSLASTPTVAEPVPVEAVSPSPYAPPTEPSAEPEGQSETPTKSTIETPEPTETRPELATEQQTSTPDQASQPGVDEPMWDEARQAYIQWDPQLEAWMEWSDTQGRWIPISV